MFASLLAPVLQADSAEVAEDVVRTAKNSVFLELLGNALVYSLNYERFSAERRVNDGFATVSLRAGFGLLVWHDSSLENRLPDNTELVFPLILNGYFGSPEIKVQLGAGATVFINSSEAGIRFEPPIQSSSGYLKGNARVMGTLVLGARNLPLGGGFSLGVAFTPLFDAQGFFPWGGVNVGWIL
jgi:hypothetical protein